MERNPKKKRENLKPDKQIVETWGRDFSTKDKQKESDIEKKLNGVIVYSFFCASIVCPL